MIYLIQKAWCDSMENHNDFGYSPYGYAKTEEQAKAFCEEGGEIPKGRTWSMQYLPQPVMWFKYESLQDVNHV